MFFFLSVVNVTCCKRQLFSHTLCPIFIYITCLECGSNRDSRDRYTFASCSFPDQSTWVRLYTCIIYISGGQQTALVSIDCCVYLRAFVAAVTTATTKHTRSHTHTHTHLQRARGAHTHTPAHQAPLYNNNNTLTCSFDMSTRRGSRSAQYTHMYADTGALDRCRLMVWWLDGFRAQPAPIVRRVIHCGYMMMWRGGHKRAFFCWVMDDLLAAGGFMGSVHPECPRKVSPPHRLAISPRRVSSLSMGKYKCHYTSKESLD